MTSTTFRRRFRKTPWRDLVRFRITGRLDIDRLLADSGLPEAASNIVRQAVKRTRLWRMEKVDVASELIAHFQDGLSAGTTLDELLNSFGDIKQTAKLIRRAKKRQRPLAWHMFAWARMCFGVFIGLYILLALYLMTGSPNINTDYLAILNQKAANVPADQAGWPLYRKALLELNLYEEREWDTPNPYYSKLSEAEREKHKDQLEPPFKMTPWDRIGGSLHPDDPGWSATVQYLREHADTFDLIRQGAEQPSLGFVVGFDDSYSPEDRMALGMKPLSEIESKKNTTFRDPDGCLIDVPLRNLSLMRTMSRLLCANALRAAEEKDAQTAYEDVVAILGLARHTDEYPVLIAGLMRLSIQLIGYRTIQDVMSSHLDLWSDEQLRDLAHHLAAIEIDYAAWFNGDKYAFYDVLQHIYTDDGQGDGRITPKGLANLTKLGDYYIQPPFLDSDIDYDARTIEQSAAINASLPAAAILLASREEMRRMYDKLINRAIIESQHPLWRENDAPTVDQLFNTLIRSRINRVRYILICKLMPAITAIPKAIEKEKGYRDGVLIGIALELYRREQGDWPKTLDDLVPQYLPSVPIDRLTGDPVHYRITDQGPVVYSIGVDGDDDGGQPPAVYQMAEPSQFTGEARMDAEHDGDWILWPVPKQ